MITVTVGVGLLLLSALSALSVASKAVFLLVRMSIAFLAFRGGGGDNSHVTPIL